MNGEFKSTFDVFCKLIDFSFKWLCEIQAATKHLYAYSSSHNAFYWIGDHNRESSSILFHIPALFEQINKRQPYQLWNDLSIKVMFWKGCEKWKEMLDK